ncbi:MAG: DUF2914 domain-containing protein [Polyangiaceae bacterium]
MTHPRPTHLLTSPAVRAPAVRAPVVRAPAVRAPVVRAPAVRAPVLLAPVLLAWLTTACDDPFRPSGAASTPSTAATSPPVATATAAPKPEEPAPGVDLLKFVLTSAVKSKDPVDVLEAAKPGQRTYAHLTVRNRTDGPKRVSVSFRVNGDERTLVDLTVEKSWSWRTWAYVTLRKDDTGELTVHVFDDHGAALGTETLPIR